MKKILLTLAAVGSTSLPLATVMACNISGASGQFQEYLQINGVDFIPEEDGVYLMPEHYGGYIFNEDYSIFNGPILELPGPNEETYIEFGKGDSLFVVYNNDSSDGYSANNFEDTFVFLDQKVIDNDELYDYNIHVLGNKSGVDDSETRRLFTGFENGQSNHYVGAYHSLFTGNAEDSLSELKKTMVAEDYAKILETLGFVEKADGTLEDSDEFNSEHAELRLGEPIINIPTPLFEYEQIAKNAVKITYVQEDDAFQQHHAYFGFTSPHAVLDNTYEIDFYGNFNLGKGSWLRTPDTFTALRDF